MNCSCRGPAALLNLLWLIFEDRRILSTNWDSGCNAEAAALRGGNEEDTLVVDLVLADLLLLLAMDDAAAGDQMVAGIGDSEAPIPAEDRQALVVADGSQSRVFILELQEAEASVKLLPLRGPWNDVL